LQLYYHGYHAIAVANISVNVVLLFIVHSEVTLFCTYVNVSVLVIVVVTL